MQVLIECAQSHLSGGRAVADAALDALPRLATTLLPRLLCTYSASLCPRDQAVLRVMRSLDAMLEAPRQFLDEAGGTWGPLFAADVTATDPSAEHLESLLLQHSMLEPRCAPIGMPTSCFFGRS